MKQKHRESRKFVAKGIPSHQAQIAEGIAILKERGVYDECLLLFEKETNLQKQMSDLKAEIKIAKIRARA